jgi:hypothetical protein
MAVITPKGQPDGWFRISRQVAFWAGLIGVGYETVFEDVDRPWLFLVFLTMMGLAQFGKVFEMLGSGKNGGVTITLGRKPTTSNGSSLSPPTSEEGSTP